MDSTKEINYRVEKLTRENYHTWKFDMKMLLLDKDLWDVVTGDETLAPGASADRRLKFKKLENRSLSMICLAISPDLKIYVRSATTGKEAWDALSKHFEEKTLSRKIQFRRKLYSLRMGNASATEHINRVKTIGDLLEALDDPVQEKDLVMILISSLPDEYNNLITTLETLKEEQLTWDYVRDRILAEYDRKKGEKPKPGNEDALYVDSRGKNSHRGGEGGSNHNKGDQNKKQFTKYKCHYCHKKGHLQRDCHKKKAAEAGAANNGDGNQKESATFCSDSNNTPDNFAFEFALHVNDNTTNCDEKWWLDSACSKHMTGVKDDLFNYQEFPDDDDPAHDVVLADKSVVRAVGQGELRVVLTDANGEKVNVLFKQVMYVPELRKRLISIGQLTNLGAEVTFTKDSVTLLTNGRKFVFGGRFGKLFELTCEFVRSSCNFSATSGDTSLTTWHLRLGHLNLQDVKKLASKNMVEGMSVNSSNSVSVTDCEGCALGKQTRLPFPSSSSKTANVLDLVHSDVCGPMSVASVGGSSYFITFIDDFSRYVWVHIIKRKSDALEKFKSFLALIENQTDRQLKRFRSDNGGEYFSGEFDVFCEQRGIFREPTNPYTPQQNGVAERLNRTIMDNVRALLYHGHLPLSLWGEAVSTIVYLRNRSPHATLNMTPFEKLFQVKPRVDHLRVFGCTAFVKIPDEKRKKLDPKAQKGIFVGYPEGCKGYKVYIPATHQMVRSRDVKFSENDFMSASDCEEQPSELLLEPQYFCGGSIESDSDSDLGLGPQRPPRASRIRREPNRYGEWAAVAETIDPDPKTYKQALRSANSEQWKSAMSDEYNSLTKHQTWELVDLPDGKNLVGCKWVFKTKLNSLGEVDRYKARLVAQGYSQEHGIDFNEVFAPVARYNSIRSLLAVSNQLNLEVHQMDVVSAFLNGKLEEEIYMKQPDGFIDEKYPEKVCRLNSSLYGLKQSARCWNLMMDSFLKSNDYIQSSADPCVYYKSQIIDGEKIFILIGVYVDDTILCCNVLAYLEAEKKKISLRFEMDDRGEVNFILGMTVTRDRENKTLTIDQKSYLKEVLAKFNMSDCKHVATPVEAGMKFEKISESEEQFDVSTYQSAIGSLNYAAISTRPDISVAVGMLSQFMQSPSQTHWTAVKRVLRYIKGTLDYGLKFSYSDNFVLYGYSDSDWAGCVMSRKSTSGHVFRIGECTVSWRSKKQPVVALSSTEAEYVALCEAAQETTWLRHLLYDIGLQQTEPTTVYEDNQGSIALARNPKDHPRTKHVDVKYHFIRDTIERKRMNVVYCPTAEMVADTFTKGLARTSFERHRSAMGVLPCRV